MPNAASNAVSWVKDKQVVLLGTGQLAQALGPALCNKGVRVAQVVGRNPTMTLALAQACGAQPIVDGQEILAGADFYLLAVSEAALQILADQLPLGAHSWLVHCAGSMPLLATATGKSGVMWPVQMFGGGKTHWGQPLLVLEAAQAQDLAELQAFAALLSPHTKTMGFAQRQHLHLLATWVSNFSNHLFHLAQRHAQGQGLEFADLHGIILQSALALELLSPAAVQAGPALRNSTATLAAHRQLLAGAPELLDWYNRFTQSIQDLQASGAYLTQEEKKLNEG